MSQEENKEKQRNPLEEIAEAISGHTSYKVTQIDGVSGKGPFVLNVTYMNVGEESIQGISLNGKTVLLVYLDDELGKNGGLLTYTPE